MELSPNPALPSPSTPIQLYGLLAGDTVQVQGDSGILQFSIQFSVRRKEHQSGDSFDFPDANIPAVGKFRDIVQSPPPSPHLTPASASENQDHNAEANAVIEESLSRGGIVTRLRSGVLPPVKYYYKGICGIPRGSLSSEKKRRSNKSKVRGVNVFAKMLKRRSSPLRPCNPYVFFLVKNWGVVEHCSFVETSKRLSKQWCQLPNDIKKEYEDMALEDNARYKRQCFLLSNDIEQQTESGLVTDFN